MSPADSGIRRPLNILCADDNELLSEVLAHLLSAAGHRVIRVDNGLAAWERMSRALDEFDVLLTDHAMPVLTGLELVELLCEAGYSGRIVVHSSSLTETLRTRYGAFKVSRMLCKGTRPEAILSAVEGCRPFASEAPDPQCRIDGGGP